MSDLYARHERSIAMAVIVVIPLLMVLALMWREQRERIENIQHSRAEITYTSCLEQNARHDRTIDQLDKILIRRKAELRAAIIAADDAGDIHRAATLRVQIDGLDDGRATTVSLIDALAPLNNCDQVVLDRFGFIPNLVAEEGVS